MKIENERASGKWFFIMEWKEKSVSEEKIIKRQQLTKGELAEEKKLRKKYDEDKVQKKNTNNFLQCTSFSCIIPFITLKIMWLSVERTSLRSRVG